MRWKLRTFLIVVPLLAVLLVVLIEYVRAPEATVPILGPVTSGDNPELPPPTEAEICRVIDRYLQSTSRDSVHHDGTLVLNEVESWIDLPREYPLIGPATLHHRLWYCEFDAKSIDGSVQRRRVYLDQNHFHLKNQQASDTR